jgi:uncharacterized protein YjlB
METQAIQNINITRHLLQDDGQFPNNALLPLLVYPQALTLPEEDAGETLEQLFKSNDWTNAWKDGVYDFDHYHSTAHEVLGVFKGSARIQFGGPSGVALLLEKGDIVIIPAGVAHKALDVYDDFTVIGAYPLGQDYDMNYGKPEEREKAIENIRHLELPLVDPIYGQDGPLLTNWSIK